MNTTSFLSDMLQSIAERGRRFSCRSVSAPNGDVNPVGTMEALCDTLLSSRGEASGMALAKNILDRWQGFDQDKPPADLHVGAALSFRP